MVRIAVNGAAGRMGKRIVSLLAKETDCRLVCALESPSHPALGKDAGSVAGVEELGVPIGNVLCGRPEVLLDFSTPEASVERAVECCRAGTAVAIGTTGLSRQQMQLLEREVANCVPVLLAPNMSVGVNLLLSILAEVAKVLGGDYDIEIVEAHHRRKADAPSGTAMKLACTVCETLGWDPEQALIYGRRGTVGERPPQQIAIHAVRGGDIVGDHTVVFAGDGERMELTHRASSRDIFARGAIRAARFLARQAPGLYTMRDVLF